MQEANTKNLNIREGKNPKIIVITDAVSQSLWEGNRVMSVPAAKFFLQEAKKGGFSPDDFVFITPSPPIPAEDVDSASRVGKYIAQYREEFVCALQKYLPNARLVIPQGNLALRQLSGRPSAITKARGTFNTYSASGSVPVLPMLSPTNVLARPEVRDIYTSDFQQVRALQDNNWSVDSFLKGGSDSGYDWCLDLSYLIQNRPKAMAVDLETVGLRALEPSYRVLCVSLTPKVGRSYVVPLDIDYWNDATLFSNGSADMPRLNSRLRTKLIVQLKELIEDPDIAITGHNFKFDVHGLATLGINVQDNWYCDSMQLAFVCDDNMLTKTLDDCTRRWVPEMAGYADEFNARVDKSKMHTVEHEDMRVYAGGDTDATFRLTKVLLKEAKADRRNWEAYTKVQMPALRTFVKMERQGIRIDVDALTDLGEDIKAREQELYHRLLQNTPAAILRRYEGGWNFGSPNFVRDILFGPDGIKDEKGNSLKPTDFTKSTRKLKGDARLPSTSKDHLINFQHIDYVRDYMEYSTLRKMSGTYVGSDESTKLEPVKRLKNGGYTSKIQEAVETATGRELPKSKAFRRRRRSGEVYLPSLDIPFGKQRLRVDESGNVSKVIYDPPTGFWQYLQNRDKCPKIHPSFYLHRTVTGRTASSDPNAQNIPKRGALAKSFRKIFVPTEGYSFIESDLSQAEIRVAAWMANESKMIDIYKADGDIHSATAATVMGIPLTKFTKGRSMTDTLLVDCAADWPGSSQKLREMGKSERDKYTVADFCDFKRFQAKAVNFGFLYGMGWAGFRRYARIDYGIDMTEKEAVDIRNAYFAEYPRLQQWHRAMSEFVQQNTYVRALHGALRRLPNVESIDENIAGGSVRQAINSPVQRFASDLGLIAMTRITRDADPELIRPVMFIHDAVIVEARNDILEDAASALKFYMETPPLKNWFGLSTPLPIKADVCIGSNLAEMEDRPDIDSIQPDWYRAGETPPKNNIKLGMAWVKKKRRGIILTD